MGIAEILVTAGGMLLVAFLGWFFFGPKEARRAELRGDIQEVEIMVKGGYSPDLIRVREEVPLRLIFDRQDNSDCTSRIVFPDFQISKSLKAFGKTALEFVPDKSGEFGFACGMNMLHGTLIVEPDGGNGYKPERAAQPLEADAKEDGSRAHTQHEVARAVGVGPTRRVGETRRAEFALLGSGVPCPTCVTDIESALHKMPGVDRVEVNYGAARVTVGYDPDRLTEVDLKSVIDSAAPGYWVQQREEPGTEETEAAARRAEIRDLSRRVLVGAVLTAPVLYAVMAGNLFNPSSVPGFLMNRWVQLALIAPVMLYAGWPLHRTGWLTLRHRTADMNTLITIGTTAAFLYSLVVTAAPGLLPGGLREVSYEAVGVIITLIQLHANN
jgi:Cu+-exporting ATPase